MARLNTARLIADATTLSHRAYQVQQDPAVQKAWRETGNDFAKAGSSLMTAVFETRTAWRRADTGGGADFNPVYS